MKGIVLRLRWWVLSIAAVFAQATLAGEGWSWTGYAKTLATMYGWYFGTLLLIALVLVGISRRAKD